MNPNFLEPDVAPLVPQFQFGDAFTFAFQAFISVFLCGSILLRLLRLQPQFRVERLALAAALGLIGYCCLAWLLFVLTGSRNIVLLGTQLTGFAALSWYFFERKSNGGMKAGNAIPAGERRLKTIVDTRRSFAAARGELCGYALIGLLITYYLVRTVPLFDFDGERLRLYGAAFTDKTTNLMSCYALEHGVPPDCLRFAGRKFPSHYFPHLYASLVPSTTRATGGENAVANFWFYVPTLGLVINGLAFLAFGRRVLKSYAAGCLGLVIYGLTNVSPELKPLDVTPALALMAIMSLDRYRRTRNKRWAGATIVLVGAMPCFETFHAATIVGALGLWGFITFATAWFRRRKSSDHAEPLPWWSLAIPGAAGLAAIISLQMLYLGERPVAPPKIKVDNVFGDSYRNTWEARARDDDAVGRMIATLDHWKRKPKPAGETTDDSAPPVAWYQQASAKALYTIGIPLYVFCRFLHIASFGFVHLRRRRRSCSLRPSEAIIGSAALIGFTVPWLFDVGIKAGGQWWSSPNLYRPTEFGSLLLALLGTGVMIDLATRIATWKRPTTWLLAGVAGYWCYSVVGNHLAPTTTYLEVPGDQLKVLAFLRRQTEYADITLHPWSDCEIRDAANHDRLSFVYKRHFTLGSNLAGRTMYYEGREDYTFSNGFIDPEEVYRRSRARKKFYAEPDAATVAELLDFNTSDGRSIRYIVDDVGFAAPGEVRRKWPVVFQSGPIRVRERPDN